MLMNQTTKNENTERQKRFLLNVKLRWKHKGIPSQLLTLANEIDSFIQCAPKFGDSGWM